MLRSQVRIAHGHGQAGVPQDLLQRYVPAVLYEVACEGMTQCLSGLPFRKLNGRSGQGSTELGDGRAWDMRERIVTILEYKKLTAKELEELSGIDREKWYALKKSAEGSTRMKSMSSLTESTLNMPFGWLAENCA